MVHGRGPGAYAISIFLSVLTALAGRVNTAGSLEAPRVMFRAGLYRTNTTDDLLPPLATSFQPRGVARLGGHDWFRGTGEVVDGGCPDSARVREHQLLAGQRPSRRSTFPGCAPVTAPSS